MDVRVVMFDSGVLFCLSKCAVNGAIFVVEFFIIFISGMISAIWSARVIVDHFRSLLSTESSLFMICILSCLLLYDLQLVLILILCYYCNKKIQTVLT